MKELSLFSGAGGGLLATKHLLRWRTIGYVEFDEYCQAVLAQRINDGYLDHAPIFGDIRKFIEAGYAGAYSGMVDIITAGFPCQPFSVAGQQQGETDERNMWPSTIECIRIIRPRYALLENVPGLLANEYIRRIYGDLAEAGYNARWCVLGADDCGGAHKRKRLWIMAYSKSKHAQPNSNKANRGNTQIQSRGLSVLQEKNRAWRKAVYNFEPCFVRGRDGMADRMDRIKTLGNGQVSIVAATAWKILAGDI